MTIVISRESVSFGVAGKDPLTEAALAMAELNRRFGYKGSQAKLEEALTKILNSASKDSKTSADEMRLMAQKTGEILLMEELAVSFREMEDEEDDLLPSFDGTPAEALETLTRYAHSLGCKLEVK